LSSRKFAQPSLGSLGGAALKTGALAQEMGADLFDSLAGAAFAVAVGCDVDNAEVDAEHIGRLDQRGIVDGAHAGDVAPIPHNHQVDLAVAESKPSLLVAGHVLQTSDRPDRDGVVVDEAEHASERLLRSPVALIGIGHLSDAAHGSLRRQAEHLACVALSQLAQIELPEIARLPGRGREKVAGLVTTLKRLAKQFLLLLRWLRLELGNQLDGFVLQMFSAHVSRKPPARLERPGFRRGK
jgi:hypothetical protein